MLLRPDVVLKADPVVIHVINLDRSPDRLAAFRRQHPHLDAVRYQAVDGAALDRDELVRSGLILEDCTYGLGTLGCALSHVGLWRKAIAENRPLTVFEDDVLASFDFEAKRARVMERAPADWEIIFWGYVYGGPCKIWIDLGIGEGVVDVYEKRLFADGRQFQSLDGDPALFRLLNSFGLQAYSVTPKGAQRLLDVCLPLRNQVVPFVQSGMSFVDRGIDTPMNTAYPAMQAYICVPPLVIHDSQPAPHSTRREMDQHAAPKLPEP